MLGNGGHEHRGGGGEDSSDQQVGGSPADGLPDRGEGGNAHEVRDGEATERERGAFALAAGAHQRGGDERRDPQVGAMRQPGEEAGENGAVEGGHQSGQRSGDDEHPGEQDDQRPTVPAHRQQGQQRGADDDPQCVGTDGVPGLGKPLFGRGCHEVRQQAVGELRQQTHGHEL